MPQTELTKRVLPHFFIILFDETEYWLDPDLIRRCGGKIRGAYLFDYRRHIHCCEFTPSYEMHFLESAPVTQPDDECERDEVEGLLQEADRDTDRVSYYHVPDIDPLRQRWIDVWEFTEKDWQNCLDDADGDEEEAYEKALDAVREHIGGNGYY